MTALTPTDARWLWAGVLAGPLAWAVQLQAVYALAAPACGTGRLWPLHLTAAACLLVAAGGGWAAWRAWRAVGGWPDPSDDPATGRTRLMAVLGMMTGVLFSLAIVAQWLAVFTLPPCPHGSG